MTQDSINWDSFIEMLHSLDREAVREDRVVEMKKEVNQLLDDLHRKPRYRSVLPEVE